MASRMTGARDLRRTLRRLPERARTELAEALTDIGRRLLAQARGETPVKSGRLRNLLSFKVAAKTLKLRLGLVTKRAQRDGSYGYILDAGRRAQSVRATRRKPSGGVSTYAMRVRGISPERYNFVFGRRRDLKNSKIPELRNVLDRVLGDAARG